MSIASEITRLQQAKAAIKSSIQAKGVIVPQNAKIDTYYSYVDEISGSSDLLKDVNFYDYDGTLVTAYTKDEFLTLNELPENPSHSGLIAQGWNWTLSDAKDYVTSHGMLEIGQMYTTNDGKTRLYITIEDDEWMSPTLYWYQQQGNAVTINWGDNTSEETPSGNGNKSLIHTYSSPGNYIITMSVSSGFYNLGQGSYVLPVIGGSNEGRNIYSNMLKKVEIGDNVRQISNSCFYNCSSLETISVSTSVLVMGSFCFFSCSSLKSMTIPTYVSATTNSSAFKNCQSLKSFSFPSVCNATMSDTFTSCLSLKRITLPDTITSLPGSTFAYCNSLEIVSLGSATTSIGGSCFAYCTSLKKISIPDTVTFLGASCFAMCSSLEEVSISTGLTSAGTSVFQNCVRLTEVTIPVGISALTANFFQNCYSLKTINLPSQIIALSGYTFQNCCSLTSITLNEGLTTLGNYTFYNCGGNITTITIPSTVASLGNYALGEMRAVKSFHFLSANPPTIGTGLFANRAMDSVIYVPIASVEAYKTAPNWTAWANYIVGE